jgi:hypothetical protein
VRTVAFAQFVLPNFPRNHLTLPSLSRAVQGSSTAVHCGHDPAAIFANAGTCCRTPHLISALHFSSVSSQQLATISQPEDSKLSSSINYPTMAQNQNKEAFNVENLLKTDAQLKVSA